MSAMMLLLNDVVFPLTEGLMAAMEEEKKKEELTQEATEKRTDTLVGPRSLLEGVTSDESGFSIKLDVQQFKPEEIKVTTAEGTLTIEGKHEEQQDEHGSISRHFIRRFTLPKDVDTDKAECRLSADGVLCICAPKIVDATGEKVIPIKFTNAPAALVCGGRGHHGHGHHGRMHHGHRCH